MVSFVRSFFKHYLIGNIALPNRKAELNPAHDEINIPQKKQFVKPIHNRNSRFFAKNFFSASKNRFSILNRAGASG